MKKTLQKVFSDFIENIWIKTVTINFLLVIFLGIFATMEPLFFGEIIKELEKYLVNDVFNLVLITQIIILWIIYMIFWKVAQYVVYQYRTTKATNINSNITIKKYWKRILSMKYDTYLSKKITKLYKVFDTWVDSNQALISLFTERNLFSVVGIISSIVIIFLIDVKLALVTISIIPLLFVIWYIFTIKAAKRQLKNSKRWESIFVDLGNAMSNFYIFKTFSLEKKFITSIYNQSDECYTKQMEINKLWNFHEIYTALFVMIARILVIWFWVYFIKQWTLSLWELFVVFSYVGWIYFPLGFIFWDFNLITRHATNVSRMYDEMDNIEHENFDTWVSIKNVLWNIEFKNVWFAYNKNKKILSNLHFSLEAEKSIALVWNTGAGKSTIINLILRFWEVNSWEILLDGKNINSINKKSLRKNIWVVSQDNSLFNTTIKQNLLYASPKATKKDLLEALKNAQADFVFDLENGIDTVIWERGLKLSWWEKQRIAIARLFLKNPKIIILDEATSALDNKTERLIQKALDKLMKWKTSIIIAHRLSTIQNVDTIYMLENGQIVEQWNYKELMKKKGKFSELANPEHLILN